MSKKDEAFVLFDQGFATGSPEVKALILNRHTRKNYHLLWKREREKQIIPVILETADIYSEETKPIEPVETVKPPPVLVSIHSIPIGAYFEYVGVLYRKTKYISDKVIGWYGPEYYNDKAFNLTDMVLPK